ncbi:MazG-like family protein [Vitreoscilla stercoraria]|uniref:MazG-like family protein n=1 Tax=Vitreoscilla stercoraria TaxID=61 RepID=A0ABY4ECT7_VITST|nr:MazG-like family protein [Vitreoscilla stercoraria]UOO93563.1 MazG-like family protein [Vitreoscilla stercoraria]
MNASHLFVSVEAWAHERNLIAGSDSFRQLAKLTEELGELAGGIAKQKPDVISDSIGDCMVVLTILAAQNGLDVVACLQDAYNEIKDRKGRMIDGVFVKEADLPPAFAVRLTYPNTLENGQGGEA